MFGFDGAAQALAPSRQHLRADCSRCSGLCCVAPAFVASADFAIDKPAGRACPHLQGKFTCDIHPTLRERGFPGCTVFDCFGAGQQVVQITFKGADWRASPREAEVMFAVFGVMRQLHEMLFCLAEALTFAVPEDVRADLRAAQEEVQRLTGAGPEDLVGLDTATLRARVGLLLEQASDHERGKVSNRAEDRRGADLVGANLRRTPLRGASLRGAYLIGADLRGADLHRTDLLGADLRAADVRAARLAGSLFLTQPQLDAATGDAATTIPESLLRPRHWPTQPLPPAR